MANEPTVKTIKEEKRSLEDQIAWMLSRFSNRHECSLSLHGEGRFQEIKTRGGNGYTTSSATAKIKIIL